MKEMSYINCNGFTPSNFLREIEINHHWPFDSYDWPLLRAPNYNGVIKITDTTEKWELGLDAVAFQPNEIKISIKPHDQGHDLIIDGSHKSREDEIGSISQKIHRICHIPVDVDTNTIIANLYPNGLLSIKAKKKEIITLISRV
uniref:SHSP domain-containing protein n=1 Tax=Acrobeloides nanus TaxID=290746 RepID=A0A914DPM9_9BILA